MNKQDNPEKALSELWKQKQSDFIDTHIIPMYATLRAQSIKYFLKDGTVSGSFRQALEDIMNDVRKFCNPQPSAVQQESEVEELINAYENYLNVLNDELNDSVSMASVHGWKSRNIDRGEEARRRISAAKEAIAAPDKVVEANSKDILDNILFTGEKLEPFELSHEQKEWLQERMEQFDMEKRKRTAQAFIDLSKIIINI